MDHDEFERASSALWLSERRRRLDWIAARFAPGADSITVLTYGTNILATGDRIRYACDCVADALSHRPRCAVSEDAVKYARQWADRPMSIAPGELWRKLQALRTGEFQLAHELVSLAWAASCGRQADPLALLDAVQTDVRGASMFNRPAPVIHPYLIERLAYYLHIPTIQSTWPAAYAAAVAGHIDIAMELSND